MADLCALADGTLDPARRAEVEATIASSRELLELLECERRVLEHLRRARANDRPPAHLRAWVEAQRSAARIVRVRRGAYARGLAVGLAAAAVALALIIPAGTPGPSVAQAAALATRGPSAGPPPPDVHQPRSRLAQAVGGVSFPNWVQTFGWRAVGQRVDRLDSRRAVTVYYGWAGKQAAYTIVESPALPPPAAHVTDVHGLRMRALDLDGRAAVTWQRNGHSCVLSAAGVSVRVLEQLAAWTR